MGALNNPCTQPVGQQSAGQAHTAPERLPTAVVVCAVVYMLGLRTQTCTDSSVTLTVPNLKNAQIRTP